MGAGTECGAPGHARRKPGREAGGWRRGGRAESQQIDSPAASRGGGDSGPGRAAATASRVAAPRDRRAAESRSEARRGGAGRGGRVAVPGLRAEGTSAPRDAPRGRACAAPSPRRPLPRSVTHEGRWGAGPSLESFGPRSGRVLVRSRGVGGAGWPAVRGMRPWGFLNGVKQAQGSFHCTALPLRQ